MQLKDKNILVTGADGFTGSHLTEMLLEKGCKVKTAGIFKIQLINSLYYSQNTLSYVH